MNVSKYLKIIWFFLLHYYRLYDMMTWDKLLTAVQTNPLSGMAMAIMAIIYLQFDLFIYNCH